MNFRRHAPKELISLSLCLQPKVIDTFAELYQGSVEECARPLTLLKKMSDTQSGLGVGVGQSLVACMHVHRYPLGLTHLIGTGEGAIEDFGDQNGKIVSIHS